MRTVAIRGLTGCLPLQAVWKDPTCGDGICEAPFEFASFSRFGCKADCGRLSDIQNLTEAQVDVYWDFSHQAASIPAAVSCRQAITAMAGCRRKPHDCHTTASSRQTQLLNKTSCWVQMIVALEPPPISPAFSLQTSPCSYTLPIACGQLQADAT